MGLGKTIQTIGLIWTVHKQCNMKKIIVVCPQSLIGNWEREFISEYGKIKVKKTEETLEVTVPCNTTAVIEWNGKTYEKGSGKYVLQ